MKELYSVEIDGQKITQLQYTRAAAVRAGSIALLAEELKALPEDERYDAFTQMATQIYDQATTP